MTKPSKLYERLLANPNLIISFRDFIRVLEAFASFTSEQGAVTAATGIPKYRTS